MRRIRMLRRKMLLRFVIAGIALTHIGFCFNIIPSVPEKSYVRESLQEKITENGMHNQEIRLYSAFIDVKHSVHFNKLTNIMSFVDRKVIVLAWKMENIIEDTFKCCILQGRNNAISSQSTKTNHYHRGLIRASRIECPLVGDVSKLVAISLAKWNVQCPKDRGYYVIPTFIDSALKDNKWAVCNKYLYGPGPNAKLLIEWFEIHRFLGVDKFTIHHERSIHPETKKVLQYYRAKGIADVLHIHAPFKDTIKRHTHYPQVELFNDEQVALWDCKERHKYYEFAADIDSDEFLLPKDIKENAIKEVMEEIFRRTSVGVMTCYTYIHMTTWEPTNASFPLLIGQYENSTEPLIDRPKNMYMPSRVETEEGNIHIVKPGQGFSRIYLDPSKAAIHHLRPYRSFWFKLNPAQILRNGTVTEANVTCSTFYRVRPIVMNRQYFEHIKWIIERVFKT